MLEGKFKKQFDDAAAWHNQFRSHINSRIDESRYEVRSAKVSVHPMLLYPFYRA
jgi:hypothetical protein